MTTYKGIRGLTIRTIAGDASPLITGDIWYNSSSKKIKGAKIAAGAWASGGNMNDSKQIMGSSGIQTSAAITITLPAGTIGDEVSIIDYAGTADSNNITVAANGSEKIHASTDDLTVATERAAFTLVFTDSTQGCLLKDK